LTFVKLTIDNEKPVTEIQVDVKYQVLYGVYENKSESWMYESCNWSKEIASSNYTNQLELKHSAGSCFVLSWWMFVEDRTHPIGTLRFHQRQNSHIINKRF
jgi:hypothetical protein